MAQHSIVLDEPTQVVEKKKSRKGLFLGIGILAALPIIGSTLAASITLNGGSEIEFGQGYQAVVACDSAITMTPASTWHGSGLQPEFDIASVTISDIADTCDQKTFKVQLLAAGASVYQTFSFTYDKTGETYTINAASPNVGWFGLQTGQSITFTPDQTSPLVSTDLNGITIESS